jgi:hypothetical protein
MIIFSSNDSRLAQLHVLAITASDIIPSSAFMTHIASIYPLSHLRIFVVTDSRFPRLFLVISTPVPLFKFTNITYSRTFQFDRSMTLSHCACRSGIAIRPPLIPQAWTTTLGLRT